MKLHALLVWSLTFPLLPTNAIAGFDEGLAAYNSKDYASALREFKPLAAQGDAKAQLGLGLMYQQGQGVAQDYQEALKWYRLASDQGNARAKANLYRVAPRIALAGFEELPDDFDQGMTAFEKADYATALREFKTLAAKGYAKAQAMLGEMYEQGIGVKLDYKEAIKWYRLAAKQGNADSQYRLGAMFSPNAYNLAKYSQGRDVENADDELNSWLRLAAKSYRLAADRGDANAQYWLGRLFAYGHGVKQDSEESEKWFRAAFASYHLAAEQGYAPAQAMLGEMYYMGQGVATDYYNEPVKWYRLAAEQGHAEAQYMLARLLRDGRATGHFLDTKDVKLDEAMKWFRIAADHGYGPSIFALALMYEAGNQISKNTVLAYALFMMDDSQLDRVKTLAKSMTNQEIKAAKALAIELSKPNNFLIALDSYTQKSSGNR